MYQDLSTRHDWPVKKAIVDLPIRMKGSSKRTSGNTLSPLGAQNRDMGAASQMFMYHEEQLTKKSSFILRKLFCSSVVHYINNKIFFFLFSVK